MSFDTSTTAAAVVNTQLSQTSQQIAFSALKNSVENREQVTQAIISATSQSVYGADGNSVTAPGQLLNGRG